MVAGTKRTMILGVIALCGCAASPPSAPVPTGVEAVTAVKSGAPGFDVAALLGSTWIAEDIDHRGVVDRLQSRLHFSSATQVTGLAGCNSFQGPARMRGREVSVSPLVTTRKMCPPAVMDQEARFLEALYRVRTAWQANGLLYLADDSGDPIVRLSPAPPTSVAETLAPWPEGVLRAYVWQCEDLRTILMRNLLAERAITIDLGAAGVHRLEQTVSASGVRYADDATVFWTKGHTARLERNGLPAVQCEERRAESLREDARERGVVYRALGNEPGWILEIGPGRSLTWTTNFGADRHVFAKTQETVLENVSRVFAAHGAAGTMIRVTMRAEPCIDDVEVRYDHSATVEFAGQTYRGCGTKLN